MTNLAETFYSSSNGDRWQLVQSAETGNHVVRHEPNLSFGGRPSKVDVPEFLSRSGNTPQGEALRTLLNRKGQDDIKDE